MESRMDSISDPKCKSFSVQMEYSIFTSKEWGSISVTKKMKSFSEQNTLEEVDIVVEAVSRLCKEIRPISELLSKTH